VKVTVTRIYSFEAAHALPAEFGGPATRMHGHTYTVRVTVAGGVRTEDLDKTWKTISHRLDHRLLNDVVEDTTVEGLATYLLSELDAEAVEVQEGNLRFARAEV
jgi:6-pyruvoyl-tetrahydropterin synthase